MQFLVTIDCDNAAFADDPTCEVARMLRDVATRVEKDGADSGFLRDVNGNTCGNYRFTEEVK
jgi:hypothetical protein